MVPALKAVIGDEQAVIYSVNMHVCKHCTEYYITAVQEVFPVQMREVLRTLEIVVGNRHTKNST